jgi:hypothetical protein
LAVDLWSGFPQTLQHDAVVLGNEIKRGRGAISSGSTGGALMPGKRVQFDDETWQAVDLLAVTA